MPTVKKSLSMREMFPSGVPEYLLTGQVADDDMETSLWSSDKAACRRAWKALRKDILRDWTSGHPGTRPFAWWAFDAPEPRLRVGGVGDLVPAYAHPMNLKFGIFRKSHFVDADLLRAVAPVGDHLVPFDPEDPPRYESQAAYLRRRKLFVNGEEKRLTDADFEPEVIS